MIKRDQGEKEKEKMKFIFFQLKKVLRKTITNIFLLKTAKSFSKRERHGDIFSGFLENEIITTIITAVTRFLCFVCLLVGVSHAITVTIQLRTVSLY